jgi:hypothetical protein
MPHPHTCHALLRTNMAVSYAKEFRSAVSPAHNPIGRRPPMRGIAVLTSCLTLALAGVALAA